MKIDMTEAMDSIMENISGRIDAMLANKIAEALTRTISRTRVQATDQDVNMADSCKKPSAKSHNRSSILEITSSHNGNYSSGRESIADSTSSHNGSATPR